MLYSEEPINILLLNSYHKGYIWTDEITRGVEDAFSGLNVDLHIEYMDTKRFFNENYLQLVESLLREKHKSNNYEVIISSDNNAFNFYRNYGREIFGTTPLVFCGVNYIQEEDLAGLDNVTGINEKASLEENLSLIESIHPEVQNILVICDDTTTGKIIQEEIRKIKDKRSTSQPDIELVYNISSAELKVKLENLTKNTIVYLTVFSKDKNGQFFEFDHGARMISEYSTVPVYGTWNFQLNHGIVGGFLVNGYNQGLEAVGKALEILKGKPANLIPINYETPVFLRFDNDQLIKHNIKLNQLPPNSQIINKPESFYSLYKVQILITTIAFSLLLLAFLGVAYGFIHSRRAEKLIRYNEENLRTTLYSIGDAVISTDLQGLVIRMNPVAEVLTGWNTDEARYKSIHEIFKIFHALTGEIVENPVDEVIAKGRNVGLKRHTSLVARDGREFKISDSAAPIHDDGGNITGVVLVFRNVSEEYRIQEELIKERNYAKRIINNAPSLICGLDKKGITTFINPVIEKITGYSEDEIIGQNFWKLLYPGEEFNQVVKLLDESIEGVVVDYEMSLTCKDGQKRDIVWNSFSKKDENSVIVGYLGFGYDITEQKKIKEALQISKKRLRTIIDLVPSSIFVKNAEGKFLALNKAVSNSYGMKLTDVVGKFQHDVYPYPGHTKFMQEQDRQVLESGLPLEIAEENYADAEGNILWQKTVKVPCPEDLFGEPAVLGIATDITNIKKAEKKLFEINKELVKHKNHLEELVSERTIELQESLDHLKETQNKLVESEKMAALGGLVAGVAHEVNTPVGIGVTAASHLEESIVEFQALYETGKITKKDFETFLALGVKSSKIILSNMKRAANLIQSFKQVAVDQSSQERRSFNIHEYIDEILLSLHAQLKKTPFEVHVNCPEEMKINSYPGALSQIITNLVMNSLHHGFEGMDEGSITIDIRESDDMVLLIYEDTGCGIPKDNLDKIFEPFFTTKRGFGGSGLGMNIVYNLVTQTLGGHIRCSSTVGVGTWFEIEIPTKLKK